MSDDILVKVDHVSKKFCRSLKKSLWYGVRDIVGEVLPFTMPSRHSVEERPPLRDGEFWAVNDVSFQLHRGECVGLIGHNGAGKTTLLKMLNGLIKPDVGRIEMRGRVGALIALGAGFNPILTGRENIYINASILGVSKKEIDAKITEIIDFSELHEFIDSPVQSYSSGMTVRLGFAIATALDPDILILDEVLAVGDMRFQAKCLNSLGRLRAKGASFILVSHNMLNITRFCNKVLYLKRGHIQHFGGVETGVEAFEREMARPDNSDDSEEAHTAGTGRITIKKIHFTTADGVERTCIRSGDSLSIWIDYQKHTAENPDLKIEISIRDQESLLHQYSEALPAPLEGPDGATGSFHFSFPSFPTNSTLVFVTVILWSADFSELFDWKKRIALEALPHPNSTGRIHLKSEMQHLPGHQKHL